MKSIRSGFLFLLMGLAFFLPASVPAMANSVTDSLGRRVTIPARVQRIGALYAFTAHVVAMLEKADRIVAVSNGPKRDILLTRMHPEIKKALVPKYQGAINIEELARAGPDIVFVSSETGLNEAEAQKLDTFGIPWIAVDFRTMEEQQAVVAMIASAIGAREKAQAFNDYYRKCLARVHRAVSGIADAQRVRVYLATNEPTRTGTAKEPSFGLAQGGRRSECGGRACPGKI